MHETGSSKPPMPEAKSGLLFCIFEQTNFLIRTFTTGLYSFGLF